jgi:hypothetical protein
MQMTDSLSGDSPQQKAAERNIEHNADGAGDRRAPVRSTEGERGSITPQGSTDPASVQTAPGDQPSNVTNPEPSKGDGASGQGPAPAGEHLRPGVGESEPKDRDHHDPAKEHAHLQSPEPSANVDQLIEIAQARYASDENKRRGRG